MPISITNKKRLLISSALSLTVPFLAVTLPASAFQDVAIVKPGAPGQAAETLSADEAIRIADNQYSPDDVRFMQGMIVHHYQAVEMARLVDDRTNRQELIDIAGRIKASQADEIAFMQGWLKDRSESAPDPEKEGGSAAAMGMHDGHMKKGEHEGHGKSMEGMHAMQGMASLEDMAKLAASNGVEFDELFLNLMIAHHQGAIDMVDDLLGQPGSAYDPVLFGFVGDIKNDQRAEIGRMTEILADLSTDPRVGLKPGFRDAGEAIKNLTLIGSLPKPNGFFDPKNPSELPPVKSSPSNSSGRGNDEQSNAGTQWGERSPLLSFSNTDMAFSGDTLVVGNYHGFNIYKLAEGKMPNLISSVVCPGGQGDVSVVGDLLIMSVEQTRGRIDCGLEGIADDVSPDRFRGLRIFDISNLARPVQVGQVQTCRGSHTHSVVSGPGRDGKIIVYNSGTSSVRDGDELAGCKRGQPGDGDTALFRIDVIEIPVDNPSKSRIVDSPGVFADTKTGRLAGLWQGGDHGDGTQRTRRTDQCHDITVFPSLKIAAGACSGNGIILDISNPRKPKRIDDVTDEGFAYWHSATFNNDGTKVLFTDEWGGGARPRCRASDKPEWGADAIYDIKDGKLEYRSYFKMPAPQSVQENCVAHNGSVVPVPGRDIFVQAWYQGGISIIDFTDSENPVEIAYFDRGPIHNERLILGGYWSAYWFGGKIYGTEIVRGLDVFELMPSDFLTENEIAAAALADQGGTFNPQQQFPVTWPDAPVVARAYRDQLVRRGQMSDAQTSQLDALLGQVEQALDSGSKNRDLSKRLTDFASGMRRGVGNATDLSKMSALAETLSGMAKQLR